MTNATKQPPSADCAGHLPVACSPTHTQESQIPHPSFSHKWSIGLFSPPPRHSPPGALGCRRGAGPRNGMSVSAVSRLGPVGCAGAKQRTCSAQSRRPCPTPPLNPIRVHGVRTNERRFSSLVNLYFVYLIHRPRVQNLRGWRRCISSDTIQSHLWKRVTQRSLSRTAWKLSVPQTASLPWNGTWGHCPHA